jgi:lysophospholipase L1-like esterase
MAKKQLLTRGLLIISPILLIGVLIGCKMGQDEMYLSHDVSGSNNLPQIIFDGDSMTEGVGSSRGQNYPKQTIDLLGGTSVFTYYNQAVSGQTTQQMIDDGVSQIDALHSNLKRANIVVLWAGTNDIYFGASAETTYNRIVEYAKARRVAGSKVVVTTILPRSNEGTPQTFEANRQYVNTRIRENWTTFADAIADVAANTDIGEPHDELNKRYYPDGVHLNNRGYAIVAHIVRDQIVTLTGDITAPLMATNSN